MALSSSAMDLVERVLMPRVAREDVHERLSFVDKDVHERLSCVDKDVHERLSARLHHTPPPVTPSAIGASPSNHSISRLLLSISALAAGTVFRVQQVQSLECISVTPIYISYPNLKTVPAAQASAPDTGWRRLIGSPKLQIIFHKRATKYRALLRKMTYKDKGSYESSPPCS